MQPGAGNIEMNRVGIGVGRHAGDLRLFRSTQRGNLERAVVDENGFAQREKGVAGIGVRRRIDRDGCGQHPAFFQLFHAQPPAE